MAPITAGTVDDKGILWKATAGGKFCEPFKGCSNLYQTLVESVKVNGPKPAAGIRKVEETQIVGGFEKFKMSTSFEYLTYTDYLATVDAFAGGLVQAIPSLSPKDLSLIHI